jgi:hypothetical protein
VQKGTAGKQAFPASVTTTASQRPVNKIDPKHTAGNAEHAKQKTIKPELMAIAKR